jgi:hypothetical protein
MAELAEVRVRIPQNEHAYSRSHLSFFDPLPHFSPGRLGEGFSNAEDILSDDVKVLFRIAESNL